MKFDTFDISNLPILILMLKMILMKYLPPASLNQFQNKKCLELIEIRNVDIWIITLVYCFIYGVDYWLFEKL